MLEDIPRTLQYSPDILHPANKDIIGTRQTVPVAVSHVLMSLMEIGLLGVLLSCARLPWIRLVLPQLVGLIPPVVLVIQDVWLLVKHLPLSQLVWTR